jgi:hypothetical protein
MFAKLQKKVFKLMNDISSNPLKKLNCFELGKKSELNLDLYHQYH